jgi:hypothetical protein
MLTWILVHAGLVLGPCICIEAPAYSGNLYCAELAPEGGSSYSHEQASAAAADFCDQNPGLLSAVINFNGSNYGIDCSTGTINFAGEG